MIPRYTPKEMAPIWTPKAQFETWLNVELAVISARCRLGIYPGGIIARIALEIPSTFMTDKRVEEILQRDREIEHDLQAFVDVVRWHLPEELRRYIHDGLTSYDTEVPALALQFAAAGKVLLDDIGKLIEALRTQASRHQWTYRMGSTHGQDAEPTTFGWLLCSYIEMLENGERALEQVLLDICSVKCSGAVGNYATISPELEAEVCRLLGLDVRQAATQIVARDVFSHFLSTVATIGGCIEKIATDLRLLATSAVGEIREPRRKGQKGSSAMPHKRNTILLERMSGMAIVLRGYAVMGQELIRTWLERDIAHSCVERIAFPDATALLDYMFQRMAWVISELEVNREAMAANIGRSRGCWASEEVKLLLERKGYEPEDVYRHVQACAFAAFDGNGRSFHDVLLATPLPEREGKTAALADVVSQQELEDCFNFVSRLHDLTQAYARFELDTSQALAPNVDTSQAEGLAGLYRKALKH